MLSLYFQIARTWNKRERRMCSESKCLCMCVAHGGRAGARLRSASGSPRPRRESPPGYVIRRVSSERGCRRSSSTFTRVRSWRAAQTTWYTYLVVRLILDRARLSRSRLPAIAYFRVEKRGFETDKMIQCGI